MSGMMLTHKICLDPTYKQERYFRQACGIARFTWNWALNEWQRHYKSGKNPSGLSLKKEFNAIKAAAFPWVYDVTKYACQQPFIFLQSAFTKFFKKQAGYPRFKKKGVHDSFYVGNDHIRVNNNRIRLPKLGWVKMRDKVAKLHAKIRCIRQDALHKLTTYLCRHYKMIVIEDLNVKGMMANHKLARHIADMGFYECRRQLEYKAMLYGNTIHVVDRWFPSSKRCSNCLEVNTQLTLSDRTFSCAHCGLRLDRDENAARNMFSTVSSTGFKACGEESAGLGIS